MMFILSTGFPYKIDILGIRLWSIFRGLSDFQRFMKKTVVIAYLTAVSITLVTFLVCFVFVLFCFDLALWSHFVSQTTVLSRFGFVSFWFRFAQHSCKPVSASNLMHTVDLIRAVVQRVRIKEVFFFFKKIYENFVGTLEIVRNREVSVLERCPYREVWL